MVLFEGSDNHPKARDQPKETYAQQPHARFEDQTDY
jgi:hypothetical protein